MSLETTTETLAQLYPALSEEWFGYLNTDTPGDYVPGSRYRAWWECSAGHLFSAQIWERTARQVGCPYCENAKHLPGPGRSLAERHPHLGAQWSVRNQGVKAEDVRPSSKLFAWWLCESGHEFSASVAKRVAGRSECTKCTSQGWSTPQESSLATLYPEVATLWSAARNGVSAEQITASTPGLYWWECGVGHTWTSRIVMQLTAGECWQCQKDSPVNAAPAPQRRPSERKALDAPAVPAPWDWDALEIEHAEAREAKERIETTVVTPIEAPVLTPPVAASSVADRPRIAAGSRNRGSQASRSVAVLTAAQLRNGLREKKVLTRVFPSAHTITLHSPIKISIVGTSPVTGEVVAVEIDSKRTNRDLARTRQLLDAGVWMVRICLGVDRLDIEHPHLLQLGSMSSETAVRRITEWLRR